MEHACVPSSSKTTSLPKEIGDKEGDSFMLDFDEGILNHGVNDSDDDRLIDFFNSQYSWHHICELQRWVKQQAVWEGLRYIWVDCRAIRSRFDDEPF